MHAQDECSQERRNCVHSVREATEGHTHKIGLDPARFQESVDLANKYDLANKSVS